MSLSRTFLIATVISATLLGIVVVGSGLQIATHINDAKANSIVLNSIGTSKISLNQTTIDITSGSSGSVSYTVELASGSTWGTTVSASSPSGITASLSNSNGDPSFSGTANIHVDSTVKNGTYTVSFSASGDDPTSTATSLTVKVSGYGSPPASSNPPPSTTSFFDQSVYIGIGAIISFVILSFVPLASVKLQKDAVGYVSFAISMGSGIFLAIFDKTLYSSAYLHWIILVIFMILAMIMMVLSLATKDKTRSTWRGILGVGAFIMSIAMIADAVLGLPLSSVQNMGSNSGFNYLFGFGTQSSSTIGVSVAFTLFLIFNGLIFSSFLKRTMRTTTENKGQ